MLTKSMTMCIWVDSTLSQLFTGGSYTVIEVVATGKTPLLWQVHFALLILFFLTLTFGRVVLHGNVAFSIVVLLSKQQNANLLKKVLGFQKSCFEVKALEICKICRDYNIKICRSLKQRVILKIHSTVFWGNLCSFFWLENGTSTNKRFSVLN